METVPLYLTLQILTNIASIVGIPAAIFIYWSNKVKERKDKEYETYHALDEKYYEYIELCLQYPELNLFYLPLSKDLPLTPKQTIQKYALFEILISLLERAHVMYSDQSTAIKRAQWEGWMLYIRRWCLAREDFRELWNNLAPGYYDDRFTKYVDRLIHQTAIDKET